MNQQRIMYVHTLDFEGPTKNSKRISVENLVIQQHQTEVHQGKFQNQKALYLVSVWGRIHLE